jgi:branched-chain amino acid transport system permease protein
VILAALPEVLRHVVEPLQQSLFGQVLVDAEVLRQLLYGLAMVVIMLNRPSGLWPAPRHEDRPDFNKEASGGTAGQLTDHLAEPAAGVVAAKEA